jgi:hypothetical protein
MRFFRPWLLTGAIVAGFAVGCNKSPEGGTPQSSSSFTIKAPPTATTIKQDNRESVKLTLDRGKEFHKDVKLKVEPADPKIKTELDKDTIKASDASTDFNVNVTPAKDAPVGEHKVKVTGTPEGGGAPTSVEFTVKVAAP